MLGLCWLVIVCWPKPPVLQFMSQGRKYFREFGQACDSLLQKYPLGTNRSIRILGDDSSLPSIIRNLNYGVERVTISSNSVHIVVPAPWHGFGIAWEPQNEANTNIWALKTFHESHERVAYLESR